jgi:serine/threonine protein kinase
MHANADYNPRKPGFPAGTSLPFASGARVGAFEVLERLGAGGMGVVYRGRDTRLDRIVALKVIRDRELAGRDRLERFQREARAISRLNHPHICALYDIGEERGEAFLVMEYVPGETLASRLERGPLRIEEVLRHGADIAEALDVAHGDAEPSSRQFEIQGLRRAFRD